MRQIPYTMMKFACFERTVELLYKYVVPKPRSECSKGEQLVVTFAAGEICHNCNQANLYENTISLQICSSIFDTYICV